jgi:hypothetical protein
MSKQNKIDQDKSKKDSSKDQFPGYPKYPGKEDITVQGSRISMDDDGLATKPEKLASKFDEEENLIVPSASKRASDVTKEDLEALGPRDLSMDMGEDEALLKHRSHRVDFAGDDLDVPGAELDDDNEVIGKEDEENNSYSLGSDNHEDLDERHSL